MAYNNNNKPLTETLAAELIEEFRHQKTSQGIVNQRLISDNGILLMSITIHTTQAEDLIRRLNSALRYTEKLMPNCFGQVLIRVLIERLGGVAPGYPPGSIYNP